MSTDGNRESRCPYCGIPNVAQMDLYALDNLFQSHYELCAALRFIGRKILDLDLEKRDNLAADRIRAVLRRADNIRRQLRIPPPSREPEPEPSIEFQASSTASAEASSDQSASESAPKSVRKAYPSRRRAMSSRRFTAS